MIVKKIMAISGLVALSCLVVACGGGGSDNSSSAGGSNTGTQSGAGITSPSDAQVISLVQATNIDFVPGANGRPAGTWRWSDTPSRHVTVYIPTPAVGDTTYAAKVSTSVALINTKLAGLLVLDTTNTLPTSGKFIQVSYGTSYVLPGSTDYAVYCANVATGPNTGSMIMPDSQNGIFSNPIFVNLGNGRYNVTQEIVTHEFGHALGLANHFDGFGTNDTSSTAFWDVLATLYSNPQSTVTANLKVKRAAK
jgi:hypothetical protein